MSLSCTMAPAIAFTLTRHVCPLPKLPRCPDMYYRMSRLLNFQMSSEELSFASSKKQALFSSLHRCALWSPWHLAVICGSFRFLVFAFQTNPIDTSYIIFLFSNSFIRLILWLNHHNNLLTALYMHYRLQAIQWSDHTPCTLVWWCCFFVIP